MKEMTGSFSVAINIIGGGSRNRLLNQFCGTRRSLEAI